MVKVKVKDNDNLDIETIIRNKRFGKRKKAELARRRPRNPNEEKALRRWERERDGVKIGNI